MEPILFREGEKRREAHPAEKARQDVENRLSLYACPFSEGKRYLLLHIVTGEVPKPTAAASVIRRVCACCCAARRRKRRTIALHII